MPESIQEEKLRQEILGDARARAERLVSNAKGEAARNMEKAAKAVQKLQSRRMAEAEAEAEARCRAIALGVNRESRRMWLKAQEDCVEALFTEVLGEAERCSGEVHDISLEQLALEAMAAVGPVRQTVVFPDKDRDLVTLAWLDRLAESLFGQGSGASFTLAPSSAARAGLVFRSDDGHAVFDNTYAARLANMKEDLRKLLAE